MVLKGGFAYIDMQGYDIAANIEESNAIYVKGLYEKAYKAVKSKKICVLYNAGDGLTNTSMPVTGYSVSPATGKINLKFTAITHNSTTIYKKIVISTNDTYYVTS